MKYNVLLLFLSFISTFTSLFSQTADLSKMEKELGTDGKKYILFHQALVDTFYQTNERHTLPFDATILCYEKIKRKKLSNIKKEKPSWDDILDLYEIDYRRKMESIQAKKNANWVDKFTKGKKVNVLSHVIEFSDKQRKIRYNIYDKEDKKSYNLMEDSKAYYEQLKEDFIKKFKNENYTHIIVASTGWNNDQNDSFNRYYNWVTQMEEESKRRGIGFKPYFIGITWPSFWGPSVKFIDYFNKANDADELGLINVNQLIWKVVIPATETIKNENTSVIMLSHSFGARIISRSIYSRTLFTNAPDYTQGYLKQPIDYFFIFQGAFNMRRYLPMKHGEAGVYAFDSPVKMTIATSSLYDNATPAAVWTSHMGSRKTLKRFNSKKEYSYNKFDLLYANSFGEINGATGQKSYKMVIADEFIRAHGDIEDLQTAHFIYQFISEGNKAKP